MFLITKIFVALMLLTTFVSSPLTWAMLLACRRFFHCRTRFSVPALLHWKDLRSGVIFFFLSVSALAEIHCQSWKASSISALFSLVGCAGMTPGEICPSIGLSRWHSVQKDLLSGWRSFRGGSLYITSVHRNVQG